MALTVTAQVRLLTGLPTADLDDAQILDLLELNGDDARLAAADALEQYATTLVDVLSDDITLNQSKRAALFMSRAARLREQAAAEADDGGFVFDVVGGVPSRPELTERERW